MGPAQQQQWQWQQQEAIGRPAANNDTTLGWQVSIMRLTMMTSQGYNKNDRARLAMNTPPMLCNGEPQYNNDNTMLEGKLSPVDLAWYNFSHLSAGKCNFSNSNGWIMGDAFGIFFPIYLMGHWGYGIHVYMLIKISICQWDEIHFYKGMKSGMNFIHYEDMDFNILRIILIKFFHQTIYGIYFAGLKGVDSRVCFSSWDRMEISIPSWMAFS